MGDFELIRKSEMCDNVGQLPVENQRKDHYGLHEIVNLERPRWA